MLQLMQEMGYVSNTVVGLSRRNHNNQVDFALKHLKPMPKLIRDIRKHLERFERLYKAESPRQDDQQSIERCES